MRLCQHPEYTKYLQDREMVRRCRQAVEAWRADGEPISADEYGIEWIYGRALALVRSLVVMFEAYNRVLWERFPYCRACGGGCCVLDASRVGPFDGIALGLLDLSLPALPEGIRSRERECVYLDGQRCALPARWRTIKCWSFYCLGGRWDPGASLGEYHGALAQALKGVVLECLPEELRRYEQVRGDALIAHLDDPTDFAQALDDALFEVLVGPLDARYPVLDEARAPDEGEPGKAGSIEEDVLAFVAWAMEQLFEPPALSSEERGVPTDQLLADLELLEWIAVGRPSNRIQLLKEVRARYAGLPVPGRESNSPIEHRMHACIARMLKDDGR